MAEDSNKSQLTNELCSATLVLVLPSYIQHKAHCKILTTPTIGPSMAVLRERVLYSDQKPQT